MFRRRTTLPYAAAPLLVAALAVPGCKKEEKDEKTLEAATGETAGAKAAEAAEPAQAPAAPTLRRIGDPGPVLGHLLVPNGRDLLAKVQQKIMVGPSAAFVNEGFLRMAVAGQLGDKKNVADNVRLDAPLGCAVVDPKGHDEPVACVFAYKGGLAQLEKDLGAGAKQADAGGAAAHFRIAGQDVFVDEIGEHLAAATDAKVLGAAKGYLEKNLVGRAGDAAGDLEVVAFPAKIRGAFAEEIRGFLDEMTSESGISTDAKDPQVRKALEVWNRYNVESTRHALEQILELEQVVFAAAIDDEGVVFRYGMIPPAGSEAAKDALAIHGRPIDPAFVARLPAGVAAMMVTRTDGRAALRAHDYRQSIDALTRAYAVWTDKDPEKVRAAYDEAVAPLVERIAEHQAMVLLTGNEPPLALGIVTQTRDDGARDALRKLFEKATPEALLPASARGYVTWSYAPGAAKVAGLEVDRLTLEAGEVLRKELEAEVKKDPDLAKVRDFLGGWKLVVDVAHADGAQLAVWAPGHEEAVLERLAAAYGGKGALGREQAAHFVSLDPRSWVVAGANVAAILEAIRRIVPAKEGQKIPDGIGGHIDDIAMTLATTKDGATEWQLRFEQSLVDGVRKAVERAQSGQAPAGGGSAPSP